MEASGKFLILDRMLPELKKRGHKVKFNLCGLNSYGLVPYV